MHTYGGGAWIVDDGNLYFSNLAAVGCIGKIEILRSRTRSRPHLLHRKEIGAMPMALSIEPGSRGMRYSASEKLEIIRLVE